MNLAALVCIEEGRVPPDCCGTTACTHTVVDHSGHVGYLVDGQLYCRPDEHGPLIPHSLDLDQRCSVVKLPDHVHGPDCGHEVVAHGDHFDFLVGDELHHVPAGDVGGCCQRGCIGQYISGTVLHHGRLSVVRHRKKGSPEKPSREEYEALVEEASPSETGEPAADVSAAVIITKIYAGGICCPSETPLITNILQPMPGVLEVEVAVVTKTVTVRHTRALLPAAAVAALNQARLDASLQAPRQQTQIFGSWLPPWRVVASASLLAISLFHYLYGATHIQGFDYLKYVALGAVALEGPFVGLKAFLSLRRKVLDINALMFLAVVGAIALQDYVEGAAVLVLFGVAQWLEACSSRAARDAISSVLALKPETAVLAGSGAEVPVDDVAVGALLLVRPGDKVPLDATVTAGASRLDHSMLTGESAPVKRGPGDEVFGGTVNCGDGALTVRATAAAADSTVARMARLVEEATSRQSPMETFVIRFAKWYTPIIVAACLCLALVPLAARVKDPKWWVYLALQILVTACPCALVLSTPVTMVAALAAAAKQGVLIKGGQVLEALAAAKVVTLDKTGTLTEGRCMVVMCRALGGFDEARMLSLAASAERTSSHPLAAAVVGCAAARAAPVDLSVAGCTSVPGQGIVAEVDGVLVAIGNARLLAGRDIERDEALVAATEAEWSAQGATVSWVAAGGKLVGVVAVADAPRAEAADAVRALRAAKLTVAMLTGDNTGAARSVAAAAGLDPVSVHSALLPEDKLRQVEAYRAQHGRVVHVGDGINDAPALAAADVGVAMGANGAAIAVEASDVALFSNDLRCLAPVLGLGRLSRRKVIENISLSVATKVAVLVLAALGKFSLWAAVAVDVGTALVVIANGMTLLRWTAARDACAAKSGCRRQNASSGANCCSSGGANSGCSSGATSADVCCSAGARSSCSRGSESHCCAAGKPGTAADSCCGSGAKNSGSAESCCSSSNAATDSAAMSCCSAGATSGSNATSGAATTPGSCSVPAVGSCSGAHAHGPSGAGCGSKKHSHSRACCAPVEDNTTPLAQPGGCISAAAAAPDSGQPACAAAAAAAAAVAPAGAGAKCCSSHALAQEHAHVMPAPAGGAAAGGRHCAAAAAEPCCYGGAALGGDALCERGQPAGASSPPRPRSSPTLLGAGLGACCEKASLSSPKPVPLHRSPAKHCMV